MDPHVRWLRRFLLGRAVTRATLEAVVVGGGVAAACGFLTMDPLVTAGLGLLAAQLFGLARLTSAILFNPVNHRYLMSWEDEAGRLQPVDGGRAGRSSLDVELDRIALHHLVELTLPNRGRESGEELDSASEEEPGSGLAVYASPSRLVVATVDADEHLSLLSRLNDGRLLVTTTEVVPPNRKVLLNPIGRTSSPKILLHHVQRLDSLRAHGIEAVATGYDTVVEQLRLEWSSWNQLGPFLGPFLAVDPRPQPLLLQVRPSADLLRRLSSPPDAPQAVHHRFRTPPTGRGAIGGGPVVTVEVPQPSVAPAGGSVGSAPRPPAALDVGAAGRGGGRDRHPVGAGQPG